MVLILLYVSILSNLKRYFLKTGEQFQYEDQPDFSVEESKKLLRMKFADWDMIDIDTLCPPPPNNPKNSQSAGFRFRVARIQRLCLQNY